MKKVFHRLLICALYFHLSLLSAESKDKAATAQAGQWESWIDPKMPFFSCVVDARGVHGPSGNLTPRALVFPLGKDVYLAWDVDLLRVAVVWQASGEPFRNASMSVNSYPYHLKKVAGGQYKLPIPQGDIWFGNGIHPGIRHYPGVPAGNHSVRSLSYRAWEGTNDIRAGASRKPSSQGKLPDGLMDVDLAGEKDHYVMIFEGMLDAPEKGEYTFALKADNFAKLYLDGKLVVANGPDSPAKVWLEAGEHMFRCEFVERGGGQSMDARWSGPGFKDHLLTVPTEMPDPRPLQPNVKEVGRGGLDPAFASFTGVELSEGGTIEYTVGDVKYSEKFRLTEKGLERLVKVEPHDGTVDILICGRKDAASFEVHGDGTLERVGFNLVCRIPPSKTTQTTTILFKQRIETPHSAIPEASQHRWSGAVQLPLPHPKEKEALNVEPLPLPIENPWERGVRAAGIDFFQDGRLAMVTFDGDVWLAEGLNSGSKEISWRRFTSGLHEPQGIRVRDGELFAFDRNGIWRLWDRDGNGEADYHELFCSQIVQTAETREFASALEVEADGSFLICKPGQNSASNASGTVLRISPDGKTVTEVARGFRQPFLGYDPVNGTIGVSDQQGHWVPSTPIIFAQKAAFYGHPGTESDKTRPVSPPLTWIPHQACSSSTSLVWMRGTQMGKLNNQAVLLSFNPPKLFLIHTDIDDIVSQGGVSELPAQFNAPLLKGAVNPVDGLLYLAGFNIWGTSAKEASWLGRIRTNKASTWPVPVNARVEQRGILLTFDAPLGESAEATTSYKVRRWNYHRSAKYGSPNLKLDGTSGTEELHVSSVKVSKDRKGIFLGIPGMREVMQLEVNYDLTAEDDTAIQSQTFLTAHLLRKLDLTKHGFVDNKVDLSSTIQSVAKAPVKPTIEKGAVLYTQLGCVGCHSIDGSMEGKSGPTWKNLYGRKRKIIGSSETLIADDAWIRESILQPAAKVAEGAVTGEAGMPIYEGVLNEEQIESIVLYIRSLSDS